MVDVGVRRHEAPQARVGFEVGDHIRMDPLLQVDPDVAQRTDD